MRTINGELFKVRSAISVELSVQVREQTALEKRVLGEIDAADDVAGLELFQVSNIHYTVVGKNTPSLARSRQSS